MSGGAGTARFAGVTELPGNKASQEQVERLYQRYRFARDYCREKDVLEVACGAGQGLGYLALTANRVVGGDIDRECLSYAEERYKDSRSIQVRQMDAENLAFAENAFDAVILYEALYYLKSPERFVDEAWRILRDGGVLIVCTVNKDWPDFNPSPHSIRYFSLPELENLVRRRFPQVSCYGGFPVTIAGFKNMALSSIKRTAVALNLIPKTMRGKAFLKRVFMGPLWPVPEVVTDGIAEYRKPEPVSADRIDEVHKVLFAVGKKG